MQDFFETQVSCVLSLIGLQDGLTLAERTQMATFDEQGDTFGAHQLRLKDLSRQLVTEAIIAAEVCFVALLAIRVVVDQVMGCQAQANPKSTAHKYLGSTDSQKWFYCSFLTSCIYSTFLAYLAVGRGLLSCEPPTHLQSNSILGDNMFTCTYCRDRVTDGQLSGNAIVIGIMVYDLLSCTVLVRDVCSKAALLNYLHHFLAIFGAATGIYVGRFFGSFSNVTLVTEFTTMFVNLRWLLHYHDMSGSLAYRVNGYVMTASFFWVRCVFMTYLVVFEGLFRANRQFDFSKDPKEVYIWGQVSLIAYIVLLGLNIIWFRKMFLGALKYLTAKPTDKVVDSGRAKEE